MNGESRFVATTHASALNTDLLTFNSQRSTTWFPTWSRTRRRFFAPTHARPTPPRIFKIMGEAFHGRFDAGTSHHRMVGNGVKQRQRGVDCAVAQKRPTFIQFNHESLECSAQPARTCIQRLTTAIGCITNHRSSKRLNSGSAPIAKYAYCPHEITPPSLFPTASGDRIVAMRADGTSTDGRSAPRSDRGLLARTAGGKLSRSAV